VKRLLYTYKTKNKMYIKLLMMIVFSIILAIVLTSSILYKSYENFGLSMIHKYESDKLAQTTYSATYMKTSASRLVMQLYVNRNIEKFMYNYSIDMLEVKTSIDELISYKATGPFIHSIYIYNGKNNTFLTTISSEGVENNNDFFDKELVEILNNYQDYKILYPIPRKSPMPLMPVDENHYSNVYTFIYYTKPTNDKPLKSAIIVNVTEEWLQNMIKTMEINTDGEIFIINNEGVVVTGNNTYSMKSNISDKRFVQKILNSDKETGYFLDKVDGKKSVIHYNKSNSLDWKFISITPYKNIKYKVSKMKYLTLLVCMFILILGIACSIFMSHRLWKPIKKILNKMNKLEKHKRESTYVLKNRMLKAMLQNKNSVSIDNLDKLFNDFNIKLKRETPIALILFKIDDFIEIKDKYNYKDREVLKFAIMNIASEMCGNKYNHECINLEEDNVVLIINVEDNQLSYWLNDIREIIEKVQSAMNEYFELSISATISSVSDELSNIYYTYMDTLNNSQYRFYFGHRSILYEDELKELEEKDYEYPVQKEQQMIDSLMLGKIKDAKFHYEEIINETLNYSYYSMNQVLLRMSLAMSKVFNRMEKNYHCKFPFNFNSLFTEIGQLETIEKVNIKFLGFFDQIHMIIEENKSIKHNQLINEIIEMINDNYKDINLSVGIIADRYNMTANYLNRIFKKHTSVSVSQFINRTRLTKIKAMLETTSKPISEIAEECGFLNTSYFYTLFKKEYGITANGYRMKAKQELNK